MQVSTKEWFLHCIMPHSMHDVSQECHDMVNDQIFWKIAVIVVMVFALVGVVALGVWLSPDTTGPLPYMPYNPYL